MDHENKPKRRERLEHEIRPERMGKFVSSPEGSILTFPDGRRMIVVKDSNGGFSRVEIGPEANKKNEPHDS